MSIFNYREQPGYFRRLGDALKGTKKEIAGKIGSVFGKAESPVTEEHLEELESILIGADVGVKTALEIIETIREQTRGRIAVSGLQLQRMIRDELLEILETAEVDPAEHPQPAAHPEVILIVGVNGVGKTTTIGKMAHRFRREGRSVLICASDTFRAAANEQLGIWTERAGVELVKQKPGADPAAVLFDAIAACKSRHHDTLIVDTAGRLHTKGNLMEELSKMRRVAQREVAGAPHQVYLVLDATTGQNGLIQAQEFLRTSGVTALIVTKLDGTARGGIVVAISKELRIPIHYVGVGEGVGDLMPFSSEAYVKVLFGEEG